MLLRRLKFLAWLVALLAILLGGSYLFAPQWLMRAGHLREAMAAKLETHSVQVGDTRWSYYEGGEGPTIVLLHGFAGDKEVWLPVAALLTAHFHLVIPDLPGWGESSRVAQGNYDVDAQAARLDAFVQALRLPRFMLAGHGTGATIAAAYAADQPQRVAGVALLDAIVSDGSLALMAAASFRQSCQVFGAARPYLSNTSFRYSSAIGPTSCGMPNV